MPKSFWKIVGTSVIGKAHVENKTPCQDAHDYKLINSNQGIAVVSDGAGSYSNSHLGSGLVVDKTIELISQELDKTPWLDKNYTIEESEWRAYMLKHIKVLQDELNKFAKKENLDYKSLSCTFILLLFSPHKILVCHLGDGRAGYSNELGNWESLFVPFKGEQVGQTVFITSDLLNNNEDLIETAVINETVKSFTLMSDGCELASWQCYDKKEGEEQYYDPNKPYPQFFNPCIEALKSMHLDGLSDDEIEIKWSSFLENGNTALQKETDDKTMILGTLITS